MKMRRTPRMAPSGPGGICTVTVVRVVVPTTGKLNAGCGVTDQSSATTWQPASMAHPLIVMTSVSFQRFSNGN